jgi:hypothetical protein
MLSYRRKIILIFYGPRGRITVGNRVTKIKLLVQ